MTPRDDLTPKIWSPEKQARSDLVVDFIPAQNYQLPTEALRRLLKLILDQANHRSEQQAS
jgi:hypothetical protein